MKLSVIVCTRNRAHAIIGCLDSIAASLAHAAPVDAEIVVVDNGSEDNTSALVKEWAGKSAFPVRLVEEPHAGLSRARNLGIRTAQGDLLVWTDDDCRLDKNHISAALRYDAADTELVLRGGRVELGDPTDLPLSIKTGLELMRWKRHMRSAKYECLSNCIIGCNVIMRRAIVDKIGFFDERFGPGTDLPGGEDSDFVFRAYLAGIIIEYAPDIVVYHHHGRKSVSVGNKLLRGYMIARGGLYAKYLFKHLDFSRPGYWDIKNAFRETISGQKHDKSKVGCSFKKVLAYNLLGAVRYSLVSMQRPYHGRLR